MTRQGPEQVPDNSEHSKEDFEEFQDFTRPGEESRFKYQDGTEENIGGGESQEFHYEGNDLPEKE